MGETHFTLAHTITGPVGQRLIRGASMRMLVLGLGIRIGDGRYSRDGGKAGEQFTSLHDVSFPSAPQGYSGVNSV